MRLVHKFPSLRIAGKRWRFDWDYKGLAYGWCIQDERRIQINLRKHKSVPQLTNTLIHEITHAVAFELAHEKVRAIASATERALTEAGVIA